MKNLLIENIINCHYEIIETFIVKYKDIFKINENLNIFINCLNNINYIKYIKTKYKFILFNKLPSKIDYYINCTMNQNNINKIVNNNNYIYISHRFYDKLLTYKNIYFLTPLCNINRYIYTDILPYKNQKKNNNIPIYIIQGNITSSRRYYKLLEEILKNKYKYEFKIKIIGRGRIPNNLLKYKNKIILKNNLNFINYHKEFLDGYCILPLITKNTHKQYYTSTLTSSINYARGYNLLCLIDKDLQNIYKLDNVEIFNNINDISEKFNNTLINFYKNNNK
tara:strand:+ start:1409 stop:2248 length:840 start_codon:yes stop_codon:yes gene_type:complete